MSTTPMDAARGTFAYYGTLPGAGSSIKLLALKVNEIEDTLQTRGTVSALLAASGNTEANFTNYARLTLSGIAVATASHVVTLNSANFSWPNAGGGTNNNLTKVIPYYSPSSGAADSACICLGQYDFAAVTDTSTLTGQINASGLMSAT